MILGKDQTAYMSGSRANIDLTSLNLCFKEVNSRCSVVPDWKFPNQSSERHNGRLIEGTPYTPLYHITEMYEGEGGVREH